MPPKNQGPAQSAAEFLDDALPKHERLCRVVETLITNILNDEKIEFLSIATRTKTKESALEKINKKSYDEFEIKLTDLTGVRIITYLDH